MTSFQEFLKKKAEEQDQSDLRSRRDEWVEAVRRLVTTIVSWLDEDDPEHILGIERYSMPRSEQGLGRYEVPFVKIRLGESEVNITPVARNVIGTVGPRGEVATKAEGRVDIQDGQRLRKYMLYRSIKDGVEAWYAIDEDFKAEMLDKDRLEAIVQDLLS
jgi:hypothetical protein